MVSVELVAIPFSLSTLTLNPTSIMEKCNIPLTSFSFPDPRIFALEESSSGSSFIAHDLRNRSVPVDPMQGLGKRLTKDSIKGGGAVAKGRGRKSKLARAKEKALFDQGTGTQQSISGVLRASGPMVVVK